MALPDIATDDDTVDDAGETFEVTLTLATGTDPRVSLSPDKSTATLVEGPVVTLVLDDDDLTEGETATVTATVDPVHTAAFTVTVATDPASSERIEFVGSNRTLSFAANAAASSGVVRGARGGQRRGRSGRREERDGRFFGDRHGERRRRRSARGGAVRTARQRPAQGVRSH